MAATVSVWSKPGAWALDSEEHEDELVQESAAAAASKNLPNGGDTADFPSLAAAASTKTKKKKPQTFSLGDFQTADQKKFQVNRGLTVDEQIMLPTGPRQRTAEEMNETRGFRSYGSNDRSDSSRWGSDRGEEGGRTGGGRQNGFGRDRDSSRDDAPSRADEIDDWGAAKKSSIGGGVERRERGERGGFFSDSQSRADDSDSWVSNKSFTPSTDGGRRYGGGFDRERRDRGGFESNGNGADSDTWGRKKEDDGRRFGNGGGAFDSLRERRGGNDMNGGVSDAENWGKRREDGIGSGISNGRPKLNLQPRKLPVGETEETPVSVKSSKGSNPFGDARPREQVLKEKGQDWKEIETEEAPVVVKLSKGSNPFGDARPREQVLKEKGQDWKEIDEKLESSKIKEADGLTFGKRGFGGGNGRVGADEERTWRKNENVDAHPPSAQNSESVVTEETEEREPEI